MKGIIESIVLGIIQGITEWLPVSSSGHLVIFQELLGMKVPLLFDVMLHLATLIVILIFFRKEILKILKALLKLDFKSEEGKMGLLIVLGNIPTAIIGYLFYDVFVSFFSSLLVVGISLIITGFVLFFSKSRKGKKELNYLDSLLIGIAQGISLIPGISRSGITISTGLLRKVKKDVAFTYSFLLSIPAIIGASIMEIGTLSLVSIDIVPMFIGMLFAMIFGYISLNFLFKALVRKKFHVFAYYCWVVGILVIVFGV